MAAVQRRERGSAVQRRQRGQALLGGIVALLAEALVLGEARLAEAVGGVHGEGIQRAMKRLRGAVTGGRRDQLVLSVMISFDEP